MKIDRVSLIGVGIGLNCRLVGLGAEMPVTGGFEFVTADFPLFASIICLFIAAAAAATISCCLVTAAHLPF